MPTSKPNTVSDQLPRQVNTPDQLKRIEQLASRRHTPCGAGHIVWHLWGIGHPVVLLHGGSGSWTHWIRNIAPLVAAGYQVIAPDLPGFGDSALPPDGRDADVMPHWLNLGLAELIGDRSCPVVGFSFGAMVGTLFAAQNPGRVDALVLVGAPALSDIPMPRLGLHFWEHLEDPAQVEQAHHHNLRTLMLARDDSIDELAIALHADNLKRDRLRRRRLARTDIVVRTLPMVGCPLVGIWGALDAVYIDREHTIRPALQQAPGFRSLTTISNAGHWVQYEDADRFNPLLLRQLNAIRSQV